MSEVNNKTVQKIATREAYGKALAGIRRTVSQPGGSGCRPGKCHQDQYLPRRRSPNAILTAVSQNAT